MSLALSLPECQPACGMPRKVVSEPGEIGPYLYGWR